MRPGFTCDDPHCSLFLSPPLILIRVGGLQSRTGTQWSAICGMSDGFNTAALHFTCKRMELWYQNTHLPLPHGTLRRWAWMRRPTWWWTWSPCTWPTLSTTWVCAAASWTICSESQMFHVCVSCHISTFVKCPSILLVKSIVIMDAPPPPPSPSSCRRKRFVSLMWS